MLVSETKSNKAFVKKLFFWISPLVSDTLIDKGHEFACRWLRRTLGYRPGGLDFVQTDLNGTFYYGCLSTFSKRISSNYCCWWSSDRLNALQEMPKMSIPV